MTKHPSEGLEQGQKGAEALTRIGLSLLVQGQQKCVVAVLYYTPGFTHHDAWQLLSGDAKHPVLAEIRFCEIAFVCVENGGPTWENVPVACKN